MPVQTQLVNVVSTTDMPVLELGNRGNAVTFLQLLLVAYGFLTRDFISDEFNGRTELSVKNFQTVYRLYVDGIVGKQTWQKLAEVAAQPHD
ncbi:peptidoglycan-binding domain 1 protein [Calothrix sp. NIES-4071]|nr:peptidoglycan-binding domain 1 protein [Calothrix sp. NIES-4071]BAZ56153.1 peptidoglycan-binding domain 1 protein [Calothrix sp. NIES-4105]